MDMLSYLLGKNNGSESDLTKYFNSSFSETSNNKVGWTDLVKKIPEPVVCSATTMSFAFAWCNYIPQFTLTNENSITVWNQCFAGCRDTRKLDLSHINFSTSCYNFQNMFVYSYFDEINMSSLGNLSTYQGIEFSYMFSNSKVKKINLSNLSCSKEGHHASSMFGGCTQLEELDMSSFDFTKLFSYDGMFYDVPTNCLIYVKDQTQVDWFTTNFPSLTNVVIKGA